MDFQAERKKLLKCLEAFLKALRDGEVPYPEVYRSYFCKAVGNGSEILVLLEETKEILREVVSLPVPVADRARTHIDKIEALRKQIDFLNEQFLKDDLTGLWNRRALKYYFEKEVRKKVLEEFYCLAFIDLNDFKSVNDVYGHVEGDRFLKCFADFLQKKFSKDFVSRYGGDEFVIISQKLIPTFKNELEEALLEAPVYKEKKISFACGLTPIIAKDDIYSALSRADSGMYKSKETGKVELVRI